eukprot:scaffold3340_cov255-Pinguiococcus_pyrenoidosus.AAC.10
MENAQKSALDTAARICSSMGHRAFERRRPRLPTLWSHAEQSVERICFVWWRVTCVLNLTFAPLTALCARGPPRNGMVERLSQHRHIGSCGV